MGILVPPCLLMVLLATIANLSVTALFLAGFLPAAVLAGVLMLSLPSRPGGSTGPWSPRASWGSLGHALGPALLPLLLPVLIFGSIFTGAATVTESAGPGGLYAWMVGAGLYRETPLRALPRLCLESGIVSAVSLWLIAGASVFTWLLAREQVPQLVANALLSLSSQHGSSSSRAS